MSYEFIFRLVGMVVLAVAGLFLGVYLSDLAGASPYLYGTTFLLVGALTGLIVTPYVTIRPLAFFNRQIRRIPIQQLLAGAWG